MTTQKFIENLDLEQIEEFFCSLNANQQHEIFTAAVVERDNCSEDEFFLSDDLELFLKGKDPIEIFELGQQTGSGWGEYFSRGIYGINFFDDAESYMLDFSDQMEDYIKENYEFELCEYFDFEEEEEEEEEED